MKWGETKEQPEEEGERLMAELTKEQKAEIDGMNLFEMLRKWRFAPAGAFIAGDGYYEYFQKVMREKRAADPEGWTAASKALSR